MTELINGMFQVLHRFHQTAQSFAGKWDLTNVEFFILAGTFFMDETEQGADCAGKMKKEVQKYAQEPGRITLGDITRVMDMSASAASKKISILEKKGLVQREVSKQDRRKVYIHLTKNGKDICERELQRKHEWMEEFVHRMGRENMEMLLKLSNQAFDIAESMEEGPTGKGKQDCKGR